MERVIKRRVLLNPLSHGTPDTRLSFRRRAREAILLTSSFSATQHKEYARPTEAVEAPRGSPRADCSCRPRDKRVAKQEWERIYSVTSFKLDAYFQSGRPPPVFGPPTRTSLLSHLSWRYNTIWHFVTAFCLQRNVWAGVSVVRQGALCYRAHIPQTQLTRRKHFVEKGERVQKNKQNVYWHQESCESFGTLMNSL